MTSWMDFLTIANSMTDGYLVYSLLVAVFVVLSMAFLYQGRNNAITFASFTTAILALFLNMNGLVEYWVIIACGLVFSIGVFFMVQNRQSFG